MGAQPAMQQGVQPTAPYQYGRNPNPLPGAMGQLPVVQGNNVVGPNGLPGWLGRLPMGNAPQLPAALPQGNANHTPPYQFGHNPNPLPGAMGQLPVVQGNNIVGPNGLPGWLGQLPVGQSAPPVGAPAGVRGVTDTFANQRRNTR
jgi:hypothetical protein